MKTWYSMKAQADASDAAEISIFGEIGGWDVNADQFHRDLVALGKRSAITLKINSYGGSVIDAYAIHNMLLDSGAKVTARVYGVAASAASYIALAASEIEMFANALFHIHEAWGVAIGTADELREQADFIESNSDMMLERYAKRAGMTVASLKNKLESSGGDWWMNGQAAMDAGFASRVIDGEVALAASAIDTRRFAIMPDNIIIASAEEEVQPQPDTATETAGAESATETETVQVTEETPAETTETSTSAEEPTGEETPQAFVEKATAALKRSRASRAQVEALEASVAERDARLTDLSSQLADANAELEPLRALVTELRAEVTAFHVEQRNLANAAAEIAAAHGLTPDQASLLPSPVSAEATDVWTTYNAIEDPAKRNEFFRAHQAELRMAARNL